MGYRIDIDTSGCLNCGVCMDVCPVEALDMSRPIGPGVEAIRPTTPASAWMMEFPIQVGECIGCGICARECPVSVVTVAQMAGPTPLGGRQGPIERPASDGGGWTPLSVITAESLKPSRPSPWGDLFAWRTAVRDEPWETWRTMTVAGLEGAPVAPCQAACPAGTDAGRYVGLIAAGRDSEAYAVAAEVNPFPSVCGWICTAPCERACRRGVLDEPISIRTLKRFAAEHGSLPPVEPPGVRQTERVAIVGGGPAGMSAAYYLARLGYPVTVFEAMPVPGGMMAIGIPDYRLPRVVLQEEIARIVGLGVDLRLGSAMGRDFTLADLERDGYAAIFLATGASKSRRLGVPGDEAEGIVPATLFLKRVNLGEPARLHGPVVVVGGGSTAMDAARSAIRTGAESVTVLYRRSRADMRAQPEEVAEAEREGIVIRTATVVAELVTRDGALTAVRLAREPRAEIAPGDGRDTAAIGVAPPGPTLTEIPATTVLVAIGEEPDPSILPEGAGIELSGWAGIAADARTLATGRSGVFAGGDVVSGPKTIIDAVASGRRAAGSIHEYLAGVRDGEAEIFRTVRYVTPPEPHLTLDLGNRPRARAPLPVVDLHSFAAHQQGLDPASARAEASRCFRCDAIDASVSVDVVSGRRPADEAGAIAVPAPAATQATTTPAGGTP